VSKGGSGLGFSGPLRGPGNGQIALTKIVCKKCDLNLEKNIITVTARSFSYTTFSLLITISLLLKATNG
jgi:hypothetical protein